jgi:DNA-binding transcriptional MerR regulator
VTDTPVEIPDRAAFRAAEVCEIAQIPPYVLRSWEKEFPGLGAAARPGGPRIYRRSDVEQILRIKQLVFTEGLTLAGVRRRIEGEPPDEEEEALIGPAQAPATVPPEVRSRVSHAKRELRELLDMLIGEPPAAEAAPVADAAGVAPTIKEERAATATVTTTTADGPPAATAAAGVVLPVEQPMRPGADAATKEERAAESSDLPLLNGVLDTPPKPRRARRPAKQAPWGPASEVE